MTRINVVPPSELYDQHLIAEYREIRLLTANMVRSLNSKKGIQVDSLPKKFTLNTGHVRFFYNKGLYLHDRYNLIKQEMIDRGFNPQNDFEVNKWPLELYNKWVHSNEEYNQACAIVRERITERIEQKPNWYRKTKSNKTRLY